MARLRLINWAILAKLEPAALQRCFTAGTAALTNQKAEVIAIDGPVV